MHYFDRSTINDYITIHIVGNKINDETLLISKESISLSTKLKSTLKDYFLSQFTKVEYYNLFHESVLTLNEVYTYVSKIFDDTEQLHKQSINLAKHLYEQSVHPRIKGGEFYAVYFKDCILDGETVDAVGLFKSENKDTFLKVLQQNGKFNLESEKGINIKKLDKGCLIFNKERENGYVVAVVDNTNKGAEAQYWINDFLHVRQRKDSFYQTQNVLSLCKGFVSQLPDSDGKANKALLLNKSIETLKSESVDINSFAEQVFEKPEMIEKFKQYKDTFQAERDIKIDDSFETSSQALKRKGMGGMTTIKLDKNFDINIHGGEQFLERGYDEKRGMYYYQLFFKEEK